MGLTRSGLRYYWRTHLAVVAGAAVAVGVLTGALLVGASVRGSLAELFLARLGNTDSVLLGNGFFREELADEIELEAAPVIAFEGMVTHEPSGRRRAAVQVYGVDERFWKFHGASPPELSGRQALMTAALAQELASASGETLLLRIEQPASVARGSLHGTKEDSGRTLRLTGVDGLPETGLAEFTIYPQQDAVRAVFLPLSRLQRELGREGRVNTLLVSASEDGVVDADVLASHLTLEDLSIRLTSQEGFLAVESEALMLSEPVERAARAVASEFGAGTTAVFTYLANSMRVGERETPYSLVTAMDASKVSLSENGIALLDWTAVDLAARVGDRLTMEFYVWKDEGRIETHSADFVVETILPTTEDWIDESLTPAYPGISETENLSDWEPPFPIDLSRVRGKDEDFWDRYGATPKAILPLERGQGIWPVRQGRLTSIQVEVPPFEVEPFRGRFASRLRERLDPYALGFSVLSAREEGLRASRGATDFGEYFLYFSYFLVVSALLLTGLFFKLGVEQRLREIGTLLATGFTAARIQWLFLVEGLALAVAGGLVGLLLALAYAGVILYGLRTWWVDAVGTRLLTLHVEILPVAAGVFGGVVVALAAIGLTLRHLKNIPPRRLLTGQGERHVGERRASTTRRVLGVAAASFVAALGLLAAAVAGAISDVAGFFGAGTLLLIAMLSATWVWLGRDRGVVLEGSGPPALIRLGIRNASHRPGRSLVAIALIAFATFVIVAVDGFRKDEEAADLDPGAGNGGYALSGESLLPLHIDPNTEAGREAANLPYPGDPDNVEMKIQTFRLRPGDDASCLNLYRPQSPRVLGMSREFREEGRFRFAASLGESASELENPWSLLDREFADGAVPVIGDANSMAYVLHVGLGDDFLLPRSGDVPLRLRLVATLSDSVFQGELLMGEERFWEHFPHVDGFRYFLVETAAEEARPALELLEGRLFDLGLDLDTTAARLAGFHRVENTYLSTFQTLGGLGLLLGTFGLAAVLLRNVLETRRELALLRAVGYETRAFWWMVLSENALLLLLGLVIGTLSALVAIAPALSGRDVGFGAVSLTLLLIAVVVSGLVSSALAVRAAVSAPLIATLRSE